MASEDVIELGSSDEDTSEPAAKKRKPLPNVMVHLPGKLSVDARKNPQQVKNSKARINPASLMKTGSGLTVTKVTKKNQLKVNPLANAKKFNGNSSKALGPAHKSNFNLSPNKNPMLNIKIKNPNLPSNHVGQHGKAAVTISPVSSKCLAKVNMKNVNIVRPQQVVGKIAQGKPIKISNCPPTVVKKSPLNSTKLPPGIIVKRTSPSISLSNKGVVKPKLTSAGLRVVTMSSLGSLQVRPSVKCKPQSLPNFGSSSNEVPTVELEDDEPLQSTGPQWYLRPEEQDKKALAEDTNTEEENPKNIEQDKSDKETEEEVTHTETPSESSTLEKQNNIEPDKTKYIEITIEDSPVKPVPSKKGFQVGAELPITVEDSPVRSKTSKTQNNHSDNEKDDSTKEPRSKKKLKYPVKDDVLVVDIEFEPMETEQSTSKEVEDENSHKPLKSDEKSASGSEKDDSHNQITKTTDKVDSETSVKDKISSKSNADKEKSTNNLEKTFKVSEKTKDRSNSVVECIDIVEIEESPIKPDEENIQITPKKNKISKPTYKIDNKPLEIIDLDEKDLTEFNSTYRSFIKLCLQLENSDDMKKIVEKKIKAYYGQVPKEYTESDVFIDMVAGKIMAMKAAPEKMYLYIKDVVDELNVQRKMAKAKPVKEKNEEQENFLYGKESEFDSKRQRQIRKLEKTLKKLHRAIQKLEEEEVDFDDEEDSVYLLTERYKERSVRVHAKLCQLTNTKMPSEARVIIDPRPGQPKGPAKRLEKWINRKVPIGSPLPFPDFHDVLRCVREANKEDKIGWNEADIMEEARDLFVRCGKKLQRRRQENEWRLAVSRVPADSTDPVEEDLELKRKLEENRRLAAKKETELFNKYADRQKQLKLEAVEIEDKEADESPVESDDEVEEDVIEITDSATDKLKRKEKIKKLLQKTKVSDDNVDKRKQDDSKTSDRPEDDSSKENAAKDSNQAESLSCDVEHSQKDNDSKRDASQTSDQNVEEIVESDDSGGSNQQNNLLQRRYSISADSSSDSDSAIPIYTSSDENDEMTCNKQSGDTISIENSTLSESEERKDDAESAEKETVQTDNVLKRIDVIMEETGGTKDKTYTTVQETTVVSIEIDSVEHKVKTGAKVFEVCNTLSEDVLLASSDDEDDTNKANHEPDTCINLRDDTISIGDTMIVESKEIDSSEDSKDKPDSSSVEGMEIDPTETVYKKNRLQTVVEECESLESEANTILEKSLANKDQSEDITNNEFSDKNELSTDIIQANVEKSKDTENISETICLSSVDSVDSEIVNEVEDKIVQEPDSSPNVNKNDQIENDDHKETETDKVYEGTENVQNVKDTNETYPNSIDDLKDTNENITKSIEQETVEENVEDITTKNIHGTESKDQTENITESIEEDKLNELNEDKTSSKEKDINMEKEKQDTVVLEQVCENVSETKETNSEPCEPMEVDSQESM